MIESVIALVDFLQTSFGPKGAQKLLVDDLGDFIHSNDGATILQHLKVQHPAARVLKASGDGTTTVALFGAALVREAQTLMIRYKEHPMHVVAGYMWALSHCMSVLTKTLAHPITSADLPAFLHRIASVSLSSKLLSFAKSDLAALVVSAIENITEMDKAGEKQIVRTDRFKILCISGGSVDQTTLLRGYAFLNHERVPLPVSPIDNAKILLLDCAVVSSGNSVSVKTEMRITDASEEAKFYEARHSQEVKMAERIIATKCNIVLCSKTVSRTVRQQLKRAKIALFTEIDTTVLQEVSRLTGANLVTAIPEFGTEGMMLGTAKCVREASIGNESVIMLEECALSASCLLVRGSSTKSLEESSRSLHDAQCTVSRAMECPVVVAGGGATEIALAVSLDQHISQAPTASHSSIRGFITALLSLPYLLATNAGLEGSAVVSRLLSIHESHAATTSTAGTGTETAQTTKDREDNKPCYIGIDVYTGEPVDMVEKGIVEPIDVKLNALKLATEAAASLVRVDEIIRPASHTTSSHP